MKEWMIVVALAALGGGLVYGLSYLIDHHKDGCQTAFMEDVTKYEDMLLGKIPYDKTFIDEYNHEVYLNCIGVNPAIIGQLNAIKDNAFIRSVYGSEEKSYIVQKDENK